MGFNPYIAGMVIRLKECRGSESVIRKRCPRCGDTYWLAGEAVKGGMGKICSGCFEDAQKEKADYGGVE